MSEREDSEVGRAMRELHGALEYMAELISAGKAPGSPPEFYLLVGALLASVRVWLNAYDATQL